MPDNIQLQLGAGGDVLAADEIGAAKYQRGKLIFGNDGSNEGDVSSSNPFPVKTNAASGCLTTATLTNGSTYNSGIIDTAAWKQVDTRVVADQDGSVTFEFISELAGAAVGDPTGGTVVRSLTIPYSAASGFQLYSAPAFTPYVRYKFTNDSGTNQSGPFYFETKLLDTPLSGQVLRLDAFISNAMVAPVQRIGNNPELDLSAGLLGQRKIVNKFGASTGVSNSEVVLTIDPSNFAGFLTAAATVRIKAGGDAADDAAGAGARQITVEGLDGNFDEASETITTAGTGASSATTTTFTRLSRAYVSESGTYSDGTDGGNEAAITIETSGGVQMMQIDAGKGQSEHAAYTVPAGFTAYLVAFGAFVDSSQDAQVTLFQRECVDDISAPVCPRRVVLDFPALTGSRRDTFKTYTKFPEKTDLWVTAKKSTAGNTNVSAEFELILVQNQA